MKMLLPSGKPDTNKAAMHMLRLYREGELGRFTLDPIAPPPP